MNPPSSHDPEQHRLRFGCLAVFVAVGILLFAFAMGAVTTWTAHRDGRLTDPWGEEGPAQIFQMPDPEEFAASPAPADTEPPDTTETPKEEIP